MAPTKTAIPDRLATVRRYIDARRRQLDRADAIAERLTIELPELDDDQLRRVIDVMCGTPLDALMESRR